MADFTTREADERDTRDRQRARIAAAGHLVEGQAQHCGFCEVGFDALLAREAAGHPIPTCPARRPNLPGKGSPVPPAKSGNKYHRRIHELAEHRPAGKTESSITVDVYSVLTAFAVTSPGLQHAAKKILCAGIRGKGSRVQDLREARDALDRAIEDAEREAGNAEEQATNPA